MNGTFVPSIGHLTIHRTYLTVNEPMIFSARNELGDLYFVMYADMTENGEAWIATRVSNHRLAQYERGQIDTRDMFLEAETGTVVFVEYDDTQPDQPIMCALLPSGAKLQEYLPEAGNRILKPLIPKDIDVVMSAYVTERAAVSIGMRQPLRRENEPSSTFVFTVRNDVNREYRVAQA